MCELWLIASTNSTNSRFALPGLATAAAEVRAAAPESTITAHTADL